MGTMNTYKLLARRVTGRPCDVATIANQIGRLTVCAIGGGRAYAIPNEDGENVGLRIPCGTNRCVDIVLDWNDTYTVSRNRVIASGAKKGEVITEESRSDVYADEVSETAYSVACWK